MDFSSRDWQRICALDDILPNTGVAALYRDEPVAVFRVGAGRVYAIANYDPNSQAAVLSRGLVGNLTVNGAERIVVASPIYKQHFDLATGECLEAPHHSVRAYAVRLQDGEVWIADALFEAGDCAAGEGVEHLSFRDPRRGIHKLLALRRNRLVGACLRGDIKDGTWYAELVREQADVSAFRSTLLFGQSRVIPEGTR
jgi:nitrite reductase (NADH) small subunit